MEKTVFILGGTKGLGLALALEAAALNMTPHIVGRDPSTLQTTPALTKSSFYHYDLLSNDAFPLLNNHYDYFIWSAGVFLKKPLHETQDDDIDAMINLHFRNPIRLLRDYIKEMHKPFHLITIASCSSWKLRECESIYTSIKAAQATFARNLVPELVKRFPGTKVTLINPGGLNTPNFHKESLPSQEGVFLDPNLVAKIIWEKVLTQDSSYHEWQILRDKKTNNKGQPIIHFGPALPEVPLFS